MLLEEVAVEVGDVRGGAAVEGAEVGDDFAPEGRILAVAPGLEDGGEGAAGVDVAVFADAQEKEPVEDALDGFVEAGAFEEVGAVVAADEVGGQAAAGFVEEVEEIGVDGAGALGLEEPLLPGFGLGLGFPGQGGDEALDGAGGDGVAGEEVPHGPRVLGVFKEVPGRPLAGLHVVGAGLAADEVDLDFLEVGEDGEDEALVPGVALGLEGIALVQGFGGFLGLADEPVLPVGAEEVIGALLAAGDLGAALDFDFAVLGNVAQLVLDVPAEGTEEGIEEFLPDAGFVVGRALVLLEVLFELGDEAEELGLEAFEPGGVGRRRFWQGGVLLHGAAC